MGAPDAIRALVRRFEEHRDSSNPADKRRHDVMVALVERMLGLHRKLPGRRIDRLVHDLYGLTEDEIAIVEGTK
jgi:hypothetical protein